MTDSSSQPTRSWEFMDTWWQVLARHRASEVHKDIMTVDPHRLSVSLNPSETSDSTDIGLECRLLRDALELVFLFAVVDRGAYIQGLASLNRGSYQRISRFKNMLMSEGDPAAYHVEIYHHWIDVQESSWIQTAITTLMTPQKLHERDREFQEARAKLLATAQAQACEVSLKFRISITLSRFELSRLTQGLATMVQTCPPPQPDYPFHSVAFKVSEFPGATNIEPHLDTIAICLADPHKRVRLGSLAVEYSRSCDDPATRGNVLSALLSRSRIQSSQSITPVAEPPGTFFKANGPDNSPFMAQVCSALMFTQSLTSVTIDWPAGLARGQLERYRTLSIRRLVTSLFSPQACHSIQEVTLTHFFVDDADMDDLEALLRHPRPRATTSQEDVDRSEAFEPSGSQIFLPDSTSLWMHTDHTPVELMASRQLVSLVRGCWVDTVLDEAPDDTFVKVIVPGYGLCYVKHTSVQDQRSSEDVRRPGSHGIKSLMLNWYLEQFQAYPKNCRGFQRFIQLVGRTLTTLVLAKVEYIELSLDSIWKACPMLDRLELCRANARVLGQIADAYESGKCHLSTLRLCHIHRRSDFDDFADFYEKLHDPERPISRMLNNLWLRVDRDCGEGTTEEEMASILKMFESNRKLQCLLLSSPVWRMPQLPLDRLKAHKDELLTVPLPVRAKLAFLSAIELRPRRGSVAAEFVMRHVISALDSDVVARIFELAAKPVPRKIKFTQKTCAT